MRTAGPAEIGAAIPPVSAGDHGSGGVACRPARPRGPVSRPVRKPFVCWNRSNGILEHFQENARPRGGGVESGFPSENATTQKC